MADKTNVLTFEHEILPVLTQRRSPRAYTNKPIPAEVVEQVFTAASSSASCFGEQPWRYILGNQSTSPEAFQKILGSMMEFNQVWAKNAGALVVGVAKLNFSHDNNPNNWAKYDVGQATATLAIEATELGLQIHQMAGFKPDVLRTSFNIPEGYEPVVVFTLGYPGPASDLPDPLREREEAPRTRKPLAEFLFEGAWPTPEGERYDQATV
ncbi:nitroreductase family protein [Hymenobacter negativus]|uniref:Nitroreductase family protein n=1 Tax=Hymenobacter negativus TaxID=2795026 RepID=A0ABS3QAG8_9BACT|nr:nitroreductase family protein [Hymenobacter negativus]MBO2008191.1 nitroreductase family protein [Hymenobacter negativus]